VIGGVVLVAMFITSAVLVSNGRFVPELRPESRDFQMWEASSHADLFPGMMLGMTSVSLLLAALLVVYQVVCYWKLKDLFKTDLELIRLRNVRGKKMGNVCSFVKFGKQVKWNLALSCVLLVAIIICLPLDILRLERFNFYSQALFYVLRISIVEFAFSGALLIMALMSFRTSHLIGTSSLSVKSSSITSNIDAEANVPLLYRNY
jgi:hypothetical protein